MDGVSDSLSSVLSVLEEFDCTFDEGIERLLSEEELARICDFVLVEEQVEIPCAVSVTLVGDEHMRELNNEWRQIDAPTDVLSLECERPEDAMGLCELGDIVLAPAYLTRQAAQFGNTPADEMRLMLIHGMLHLLGYDHLSDDEAEMMETREDELLLSLTEGRAHGGSLTRHTEQF